MATIDPRALEGLRVVVTRAVHQAGSTTEAFEAAGAEVELLPLLEVVPPADPTLLAAALAHLEEVAWVCFTSPNAVEHVLRRLPGGGAGWPAGVRVAAVGPSTGDRLRDHGLEPDLEAADSRAEGLAAELAPLLRAGGGPGPRVLLPQAADARPVLERELRRAGARPERVDAYAKRVPPESRERAEAIFGTSRVGWVTFTSPSIARAFAGLWSGEEWPRHRRTLCAVSIGPVTSAALRELGVEPAAEAAEPGDAGMVRAVIAAVADRGRGRA